MLGIATGAGNWITKSGGVLIWHQLYVLLSVFFVGWCIYGLLAIPADFRNPNPMGFVYCLALFLAIPCLGYILLFKLLVPRLFERVVGASKSRERLFHVDVHGVRYRSKRFGYRRPWQQTKAQARHSISHGSSASPRKSSGNLHLNLEHGRDEAG